MTIDRVREYKARHRADAVRTDISGMRKRPGCPGTRRSLANARERYLADRRRLEIERDPLLSAARGFFLTTLPKSAHPRLRASRRITPRLAFDAQLASRVG